jgi:hypothetical protein
VFGMSGKNSKNKKWPHLVKTLSGYTTFKIKWKTYHRDYYQLAPQIELVQLFQENFMSKKTANHLKDADSMTAEWIILDKFYYATKTLMLEFQKLPRIKQRHFQETA